MTGFILTVESDDLARIFTNALAFFPARGVVDTALLRVFPGYLQATGTDTYTAGRDWCEYRDIQTEWDTAEPIEIELGREGWRDIEAQARKDKGHTSRLEFIPGDALIFHPGSREGSKGVAQDMSGQGTKLRNTETLVAHDVWSLIDDLLSLMTEGRDLETPSVICLDPSYFVRFNKVRSSSDAERVLDIHYQGEGLPLLIKVGPTFLGAIMPIDRVAYAAEQPDGQEGLW